MQIKLAARPRCARPDLTFPWRKPARVLLAQLEILGTAGRRIAGMPGNPSKKVERFLRRLQRRGRALHLTESSGIGLFVAAVGGVAVVAVMAWRHRPAETAVIAVLSGGVVVGAIIGLFRQPGRLTVAEEADRQLHLPELLHSAAMLPVAGAAMRWIGPCARRWSSGRRGNARADLRGEFGCGNSACMAGR